MEHYTSRKHSGEETNKTFTTTIRSGINPGDIYMIKLNGSDNPDNGTILDN